MVGLEEKKEREEKTQIILRLCINSMKMTSLCVRKTLGFGPHYVSLSQSWIVVGLKPVFLTSQLNISLYGIFPSDLCLKKNSFLQCMAWFPQLTLV